MRTPVLDAFIEKTLDEYVPGRLSGTRITIAPIAILERAPEYVDPADVFDDNGDETLPPPPPPSRPRPIFLHAIRRFAPPRRS